jgi:cytochrome c oxidase cbb3-type subunit I/II
MDDPRSTSPGSIMPAYPWMLDRDLDLSHTEGKIRAMTMLGVPYPKNYDKIALADLEKQAKSIQENLAKSGIKTSEKKEIIAMIAYLQRLGTDIKAEKVVAEK